MSSTTQQTFTEITSLLDQRIQRAIDSRYQYWVTGRRINATQYQLYETGITNRIYVRPNADSYEYKLIWGNASGVNIPVRIEREADGEWRLAGVDYANAVNIGSKADTLLQTPIAGDVTRIVLPGQSFRPGRIRSNAVDTLIAYVEPFHYWYEGAYKYFAGGTLDLTSARPGTAGQWRWVKIGVNPITNALTSVNGTEQSDTEPLTVDLLNAIAMNTAIVCGGIKIRNGQTNLATAETDVVDGKPHFFVPHPLLQKSNLTATTNPAAANDNTQGYAVGSAWVNTSTDAVYFCADATTGAAVWRQTGGGGASVSAGTYEAPTITVDSLGVITAMVQNYPYHIEVLNTSGTTAVAGDVGFINASGEYKTTTTVNLDAVWCAVIVGGANGTNIKVARRGKVTLNYVGTAPNAGDYLVTSATAGKAQRSTIMRPEIFARCVSAGSGGTVSALLLTGTTEVKLSSATLLWGVATGHGISAFASTISGAPTTTSVVYGAITSGNEEIMKPWSTPTFANLALYNSTRGTYRLITDVNLATNTITTIASTDTWASGDTITVDSPVTSVGAGIAEKMMELQVTDYSVIPNLSRAITIGTFGTNTVLGGFRSFHPLEAWAGSKQAVVWYPVANQPSDAPTIVNTIDGRFCTRLYTGTGGTGFTQYFTLGALVATP